MLFCQDAKLWWSTISPRLQKYSCLQKGRDVWNYWLGRSQKFIIQQVPKNWYLFFWRRWVGAGWERVFHSIQLRIIILQYQTLHQSSLPCFPTKAPLIPGTTVAWTFQRVTRHQEIWLPLEIDCQARQNTAERLILLTGLFGVKIRCWQL